MRSWIFFKRRNRNKGKQRFRNARDRGCKWLLETCHPDGSFGDESMGLNEYYKMLSALQVCCYSNSANQLCDWIRRNGITAEGDFYPRNKGYEDYGYTYPNSWLILGAHRFGHFDISQKGMDFLVSLWHII